MLTGVQFDRRRCLPASRLSENSLLGGYIEFLGRLSQSPVNRNCVLVFILLMHLDIFYWMEAANLFVVDSISRDKLSGPFVSDSLAPGVDCSKCIEQKNGRGDKIHYHKLGYSFERNGGSGGSDVLLNSTDEALNFRDMLLFGSKVQV